MNMAAIVFCLVIFLLVLVVFFMKVLEEESSVEEKVFYGILSGLFIASIIYL